MPKNLNVLIVDDELEFIYFLQKTLMRRGFDQIHSEISAQEAARYIAGLAPYELRRIPDLIFLDLKIAGVDGFDLLAWLRRDPVFEKIPVIILSGSSDPEDRDRAMDMGANGYYEKPNQFAQLASIVEKVLASCVKANF